MAALFTSAPRPIARVAVDMSLPHLDRPFDYLVPDKLAESAQPGVRVRVRFAGQLRDGFILELAEEADGLRSLAPLERVLSAERVLTAEVARLVRAVADHYAGTFSDVMRLAVPPRHAATQKAEPPELPAPLLDPLAASPFDHYPTGPEFLAALKRGQSPRASWQVVPAHAEVGDWARGLAAAAHATLSSGRGALLIVPDARDLARLGETCAAMFGGSSFVTLSAEDGPAARYRAFLAVSRGHVKLVLGTRAAAYAPVHDLGLVALWDDGDDLHSEPRAPYPHVREVLALRAQQAKCAVLFAGHHRTCEVEQFLQRGWLLPLALDAQSQRRFAPAVRLAGDSDWALERDPLAQSVRMPRQVFEAIRVGLAAGPVLVQVPRAGYLVVLVCAECRAGVRCPHCHGPVRAGSSRATCDWCARPVTGWRCPECDNTTWRAPVVGAERTAEELGHAFPGTRIIQSQGDRVVDHIDASPALVVATPGAEPRAELGYAAAVLLDADNLLTRADLRAQEEAHRRWINAVGLVRGGAEGGTVIAVGPTDSPPLQALVRSDPGGFASRELADRESAQLAPARKMATVEGPLEALAQLVEQLAGDESAGLVPEPDRPDDLDVFGPVELPRSAGADGPIGRLTLRVPLGQATQLVEALSEVVSVRSAKKMPGALRVRIDPVAVS